jgi:hypothetical protein
VYLKQIQTMASFMMTIPAYFTKDQVEAIIGSLGLSKKFTVDTSPAQSENRVKYFVHLEDLTPDGRSLADQLADVERRKTAGEANVWAKRIVHGTRRDGTEMYWQIYKTATPAERAAKTAQQAEKAVGEKMAPHIK